MKNKTTLLILIVAIVIVGWLLFKYLGNSSDSDSIQGGSESKIQALHFFENKKHIVVGQIELPNPCQKLKAEAVVRESSPEQVTILLSSQESGDMCAQVIASAPFEVEFEASKNAKINAMLNNAPINLDLKNASAEEITKYKLNLTK